MAAATKMKAENLNFFYGAFKALDTINLEFQVNQVTALIGPSGCGKSTFLRCLNRMNDLIPSAGWMARCCSTCKISIVPPWMWSC